jgi:hypothetical protein
LKAPGLRARGKIEFEEGGEVQVIPFENGYGTVDWTKQLAARKTIWKWVSLSGSARLETAGGSVSEAIVGINFSTG